MTTADIPTLDQTLALARRLRPQDRARLIAVLAEELAAPTMPEQAGDAWARWAALREDIGRTYPDARLGDRLEADRRERDAALCGQAEAGDAHA